MDEKTNKSQNFIDFSDSVAEFISNKLKISQKSSEAFIGRELQRHTKLFGETNEILISLRDTIKEQGIPKVFGKGFAIEAKEANSTSPPIASIKTSGSESSAGSVATAKSELEEIDKPKKVEITNFSELVKILPEAFKTSMQGLTDKLAQLTKEVKNNSLDSNKDNGEGILDFFKNSDNWGLAGKAGKYLKKGGGAAKQLAKKIFTKTATTAGKEVLETTAKQAGKEVLETTAKQAGKEVLETTAKQAGKEVLETTAKQAGKEVLSKGTEAAVKQTEKATGEAVAEKATSKILSEGTEAAVKQAEKTAAETVAKSSVEGLKAKIAQAIAKRIPKAFTGAIAKSIPFLGAAIGGAFAVPRLLRGDYVGAAGEVASGVGSLATSIPITAALVAKDVYEEVYGMRPEKDPQAGERLKEITNQVKEAAAAFLDKDTSKDIKQTAPAITPEPVKEAIIQPDISKETSIPEPGKEVTPAITPEPVKEAMVGQESPKQMSTSEPVKETREIKAITNPIERRKQTEQEWIKKGYKFLNDIPKEELEAYTKEFAPKNLRPEAAKSALHNVLAVSLKAQGAKADTGSNENVVSGAERTAIPVNGLTQAPPIIPEPVKEAVVAQESPKQLSESRPIKEEAIPAIAPEPVKQSAEGKLELKSNAEEIPKLVSKKRTEQEWIKKGYKFLNDIPKEELEAYTKEFAPKSLPPAYAKSSLHKILALNLVAQGAKADTGSNENVVSGAERTVTSNSAALPNVQPVSVPKNNSVTRSNEPTTQPFTETFSPSPVTSSATPQNKTISPASWSATPSSDKKQETKQEIKKETSKTEQLLEQIAINTTTENQISRNLIDGFNAMAAALEKTLGTKMPTISKPSGNSFSDIVNSGNSDISNFRKFVEQARFKPA